ncbi:MAG: hypothetical protein ABR612_11975 [Chromatocurvus sp.]
MQQQQDMQQAKPRESMTPGEDWHSTIKRGNAHFEVGRYYAALRWYRHAADLVEQYLADMTLTAPLLLAKVITLQNAAATCARLCEEASADSTYREVHSLVRDIALDPGQSLSLRAIALRQCRQTLSEWSAFRAGQSVQEGVTWH